MAGKILFMVVPAYQPRKKPASPKCVDMFISAGVRGELIALEDNALITWLCLSVLKQAILMSSV